MTQPAEAIHDPLLVLMHMWPIDVVFLDFPSDVIRIPHSNLIVKQKCNKMKTWLIDYETMPLSQPTTRKTHSWSNILTIIHDPREWWVYREWSQMRWRILRSPWVRNREFHDSQAEFSKVTDRNYSSELSEVVSCITAILRVGWGLLLQLWVLGPCCGCDTAQIRNQIQLDRLKLDSIR